MPPSDYYPIFLNKTLTDPVFNDSTERIKWRQNQNYDICFLMAYCRERGYYYLNLEDDVLARPRFVTDIMQFINNSDITTNKKWLILEFSELGFIGKLFRTRYINHFVLSYILYRNGLTRDPNMILNFS